MRAATLWAIISVALAACGGPPTAGQVPDFPLVALQGPHAQRARVYVDTDGSFYKFAIYVGRDGVPSWVLAMADEKIGRGEDKEFELEEYVSGARVFEITRIIDGREVEIAIRADKTFLYVERKGEPGDLSALPPEVKIAVDQIDGFTPNRVVIKEGPHTPRAIKVEGTIGEEQHAHYFAPDGQRMKSRRTLPAVVVLAY